MKHILKNRLFIIVFTTGASIMMLEITGSRVLAPYFGASIIVWTSLIGLIMGSLSIGYWWGGKLADRTPSMTLLSTLILWAAFGITVLALVKGVIAGGIQAAVDDLRVGAVLVTLILFCPPSILLAMVSPYAARLSIDSAKTSGETVGRLYALSTLGSIVGTFASGFVLLSLFGNTAMLLFIAFLLWVVAVLGLMGRWTPKNGVLAASMLVFILGGILLKDSLVLSTTVIEDRDTSYQRIQIHESIDEKTNRPTRYMLTDGLGIQSARFQDTDDDTDLVLEYTKFYRIADHFMPDPERILMVGGAAFSVPRDVLARHPDAQMDVVELDPGMTDIAREYFDLEDDTRMTIVHNDGRAVLEQTETGIYDVILMDAFQSVVAPFQLTTQEAVQKMHQTLSDDGIVVANIISPITGERGQFLQSELSTYESVFENVFLFPVRNPGNGEVIQNVMLVATKGEAPVMNSSDPEIQRYLSTWWRKEVPEGRLLTDDYAPVEKYAIDMIR